MSAMTSSALTSERLASLARERISRDARARHVALRDHVAGRTRDHVGRNRYRLAIAVELDGSGAVLRLVRALRRVDDRLALDVREREHLNAAVHLAVWRLELLAFDDDRLAAQEEAVDLVAALDVLRDLALVAACGDEEREGENDRRDFHEPVLIKEHASHGRGISAFHFARGTGAPGARPDSSLRTHSISTSVAATMHVGVANVIPITPKRAPNKVCAAS